MNALVYIIIEMVVFKNVHVSVGKVFDLII